MAKTFASDDHSHLSCDVIPRAVPVLHSLRIGFVCYFLTSVIVVLGVLFGYDFLLPVRAEKPEERRLLDCFCRWDGRWYVAIATDGYTYDSQTMSSVAFFPAYPLLGRLFSTLTGSAADLSLVMISHAFLLGAFVMLGAYVRERFPDTPREFAVYVLLAFGLWPPGFFARMAYSESLFLFLAVLILYSIKRGWPLVLIAILIGIGTATRPVGVVFVPVLISHLWQRSPSWGAFLRRAALHVPLACWGIAAYVIFQIVQFGEPWAFALTQAHWQMSPRVPLLDKVFALIILEPVWGILDPSSPVRHSSLLSAPYMDRFFFVGAIALFVVGWMKRWLSKDEIIVTGLLLLIPYATRGYEMCMASTGRFASVAFPIYLVLGRLVCSRSVAVAAALVGIAGFLLGVYAALFAADYWYV